MLSVGSGVAILPCLDRKALFNVTKITQGWLPGMEPFLRCFCDIGAIPGSRKGDHQESPHQLRHVSVDGFISSKDLLQNATENVIMSCTYNAPCFIWCFVTSNNFQSIFTDVVCLGQLRTQMSHQLFNQVHDCQICRSKLLIFVQASKIPG